MSAKAVIEGVGCRQGKAKTSELPERVMLNHMGPGMGG
jgi:hypothetical protein